MSSSISIHALVKRATLWKLELNTKMQISIHALVKRATPSKRVKSQAILHFNPRPREEGDSLCQ